MMPVGQMTSMGQIHAEDRIAGIQYGRIGRFIGLRSRMGLNVNVLGAEEFLSSLAGKIFHCVDMLAAAVISLSGVTLRIFVGENTARGLQNRFGGEIFAGDQLQAQVLAPS